MHGVRAANAILACNNALIPALMPELPEKQKEALAYGVKVPLVYTNVAIRNWTSFQKLGVRTRAQLVKVALEQYRDQL